MNGALASVGTFTVTEELTGKMKDQGVPTGSRSSRRWFDPWRIDPRGDGCMHNRSPLHERRRICTRGSHLDVLWLHARASDRHRPRSDRGIQLSHRRGNFRRLRQIGRCRQIKGDHRLRAGTSTAGRIASRKPPPSAGRQTVHNSAGAFRSSATRFKRRPAAPPSRTR